MRAKVSREIGRMAAAMQTAYRAALKKWYDGGMKDAKPMPPPNKRALKRDYQHQMGRR